MAGTITIQRNEAVALMGLLGMATADQYSKDKMIEKLKSVPKMAADKKDEIQANTDASNMVDMITEAMNEAAEIVLVGYEDKPKTTEKKKVKVKIKSKDSKKAEPAKTEKVKVKVSAKDKKAAAKSDKKAAKKTVKAEGVAGRTLHNTGEKPGVINHMIELLLKASKEKPITREKILDSLKKKFKDRNEEAMRVTVVSQLPTRLKKRPGLKVMGDTENGFWAKKVKEKTEAAA